MRFTTLHEVRARSQPIPLSLVMDDLRDCERIIEETLRPFEHRFGNIVQHLRHYRGKRLRPVLLLLAGHACGQVTRDHHVLGAVAELVHTATLVHDDVLDGAATRRHVATVNSLWGDRTSLLLGDMLFSAAFQLCSTVDAQACDWIGQATNRVCSGELLQVSRAGRLDLDEETYFEIVAGKTGALTECCTRLGAHYAGAAESITDNLASFGLDLGMAFQIADDVLDIRGTENQAGKTLGTDLAQRKMTLPMIRAMAEMKPTDQDSFREALQAGEVGFALELIGRTSAIDSALQEAIRLVDSAKAALVGLRDTPYRSALEQVADWAVRRDR